MNADSIFAGGGWGEPGGPPRSKGLRLYARSGTHIGEVEVCRRIRPHQDRLPAEIKIVEIFSRNAFAAGRSVRVQEIPRYGQECPVDKGSALRINDVRI